MSPRASHWSAPRRRRLSKSAQTERAPPLPAELFTTAFRDQSLQSGKPAASGGFVAELEVEPAVVELVLPVELVLLLPLRGVVVVPELVLGVSFRTCFVTLSQHFPELEDVVLGEVVLGEVVVEVWAAAKPMLPTSIAAAINPIPVIRMRRILFVAGEPRRALSPGRLKTGEAGSRSLRIA